MGECKFNKERALGYRDQSWKAYEGDADSNPFRLITRVIFGMFGIGFLIVLGSCVFTMATAPIRMANSVVAVAVQEFSPKVLLEKYEWFKDAAASLDKKRADMGVYQSRIDALKRDYANTPRASWARDDREQMSIWQSEAAGIKASYNQLAAEYNAQMAKFNWRFTEVGNLPQGATVPLPREFKPYVEE